jgi:hypothetical protein
MPHPRCPLVATEALLGDARVEHIGIQVSPIGPTNNAQFRMDSNLRKKRGLAKGRKDPGELHKCRHVNFPFYAIVKTKMETVAFKAAYFHNILKHLSRSSAGISSADPLGRTPVPLRYFKT